MSQKLSSLSVFFPCYNESESLPSLLEHTVEYISTIAKKYEILVIDDGSCDGTKELVQKLSKKNPSIKLISHVQNRGYGATLKTGIESASYEWTFWTDGDLQFHIEDLEKFLPFVQKYPVIIGYRAHRADRFIRKVNGELYTRLINLLFAMDVIDIDCAFKLIRSSELKKLHITSSSAFTSAEILIRLHKNKAKMKQLSVPHYVRKHGQPTGGSLRVIFRGLSETLSFYLHSR